MPVDLGVLKISVVERGSKGERSRGYSAFGNQPPSSKTRSGSTAGFRIGIGSLLTEGG